MKTVNQRAKDFTKEVIKGMSPKFHELNVELEELVERVFVYAAIDLQEFIPIEDNQHLELQISELVLLKTTNNGLYLGYYDKERNRFLNQSRSVINASIASFRPLTHKIEV